MHTTPAACPASLVRAAEAKRRTALHLAAAQGHAEIAEQVIAARRLAVSVKDADGWLPLHHAAAAGHADIAAALLAAGSEVEEPAADGDAPLHKAALGGHLAVVRLLKGRSQVCRKNFMGWEGSIVGRVPAVAHRTGSWRSGDDMLGLPLCWCSLTSATLQASPAAPPALACCWPAQRISELPEHTHPCVSVRVCDVQLDQCNSAGSTPLYNAASQGHAAHLTIMHELVAEGASGERGLCPRGEAAGVVGRLLWQQLVAADPTRLQSYACISFVLLVVVCSGRGHHQRLHPSVHRRQQRAG